MVFPDLGWAWLTRFFMLMGSATASSCLTYYLIAKFAISNKDIAHSVFLASSANAIGLIVTTAVCGFLSDKVGRRKPFVVVASLVASVGLVGLAFAPSFELLIVAQLVIGLGVGCFLAVELALITDVLPSADDSGKDLGVINIAQTAPQSLVPALAPAAVSAFGYPGLFISGAVMGILAAISIGRVKAVK